MPKVGMQPVRRRQLIDATIETIHRHGFADTTISRIASAAGMSSGIISHYFGGKNALLEATMRFLMQELRNDYLMRLDRAKTPVDRLEAIVNTNFNEEQFTPQVTVRGYPSGRRCRFQRRCTGSTESIFSDWHPIYATSCAN